MAVLHRAHLVAPPRAIDHVTLATGDHRAAKQFYERALRPLGFSIAFDWPERGRPLLRRGPRRGRALTCSAGATAGAHAVDLLRGSPRPRRQRRRGHLLERAATRGRARGVGFTRSAWPRATSVSGRGKERHGEGGYGAWTRGTAPVSVPLGRRPDRGGGVVRGPAHRAGDPAARVRGRKRCLRNSLLLLQPRRPLPAQPDDDRQRGLARWPARRARRDAEAPRASPPPRFVDGAG